jgi:hypothetical protein
MYWECGHMGELLITKRMVESSDTLGWFLVRWASEEWVMGCTKRWIKNLVTGELLIDWKSDWIGE